MTDKAEEKCRYCGSSLFDLAGTLPFEEQQRVIWDTARMLEARVHPHSHDKLIYEMTEHYYEREEHYY